MIQYPGEACVLIPSYPLLTAASPDRPGLVAATFNGCWALGQDYIIA